MARPLSSHQAVDGCGVGAALVDRDLLWHVVPIDGALEESAHRGHVAVRPQQEVHRLAESVDGAVQILPLAAHLDVGLVHAPRRADRTFATAKHRRQDQQHLQRPAVHRGMENATVAASTAVSVEHLFAHRHRGHRFQVLAASPLA
jgi:hypothetical protein